MNAAPAWVPVPVALALHERLRSLNGIAPAKRDTEQITSVLGRAAMAHAESMPDVFRLAATYALGIARDRPFGPDSEAMALTIAGVFLALNGKRLICSEVDAATTTRALALRELDAAGFAMFLEGACTTA